MFKHVVQLFFGSNAFLIFVYLNLSSFAYLYYAVYSVGFSWTISKRRRLRSPPRSFNRGILRLKGLGFEFLVPRYDISGQISSRPHTTDFPQKAAKEGNSPAISGKSRLVKYYILARYLFISKGGSDIGTVQQCLWKILPTESRRSVDYFVPDYLLDPCGSNGVMRYHGHMEGNL